MPGACRLTQTLENTETMQAITTKYISPTNHKGSRVKAECERGQITIDWDDALNATENHIAACKALRLKFAKEDEKEYGQPVSENPWLRPMAYGSPKSGRGYVFCFACELV